MYYSAIKEKDIANGPGVRTTLFVSGCRNHCKGCFQPQTWDFCCGQPFTEETENLILKSLEPSYVQGLTLLGGDPFEEENQEGLINLLRKVHQLFPNKDIWAFTGYLIDDLMPGHRKHTKYTDEILTYLDVLVDGPFIEEQKNLLLKFRGSENQRLINMKHFLETGEIIPALQDRH